MFVWVQFAICLVLIGIAGVKLTHYGDAIADKSGLGRTWVGVLMLAAVTSLPELATGISSVTAANVPDIAVGDILGSCGLLCQKGRSTGNGPLSFQSGQYAGPALSV